MLRIKPNNYIVIFEKSRADQTAHRCVAGMLAGILLMTLITLIAGCSRQCREGYGPDTLLAYESGPPHVSPKLLLRSPAESSLDPQYFAGRSDWPSVTGDVELERVSFYRDYWYNRQSLTPGVPDYSYNLFQSYRFGVNAR